MSYGIVWEPEVRTLVLALSDPGFVSGVLDGADRLATAPTRLSRSRGAPYYCVEQHFEFQVASRQVTLFFRYCQDEERLHITDISILPPF